MNADAPVEPASPGSDADNDTFDRLFEDPRFDRLLAGALTEDELTALAGEVESDPERKAALEALRPVDTAVRDRIRQRAREGLADRTATHDMADASRTGAAPLRAGVDPSGARLPVRSGTRRAIRAAVGGMSVAAAAAIAMVIMTTPARPLPPYSLTVRGGDQLYRSAANMPTTTVRNFAPGSTVTFLLRPAQRAEDAVVLAAWQQIGDDVERFEPGYEISEGGVIRIRGPADRLLGGPPGDRRVILVVSPTSTLPPLETLLQDKDGPWQTFVTDLRVTAGP